MEKCVYILWRDDPSQAISDAVVEEVRGERETDNTPKSAELGYGGHCHSYQKRQELDERGMMRRAIERLMEGEARDESLH